MALNVVTVTTDATALLGTVVRRHNTQIFEATMFAEGTWGGTTVNWLWSPDGGATKLPITTAPGTATSSTANDSFNIKLGTGKHNSDKALLYAQTVGGSGINLKIGFMDNN